MSKDKLDIPLEHRKWIDAMAHDTGMSKQEVLDWCIVQSKDIMLSQMHWVNKVLARERTKTAMGEKKRIIIPGEGN